MESKINYKIKKSRRAKYMRLTIYPDASVVLTVPWWTPEFLYNKFVENKRSWVLAKIKNIKSSLVEISEKDRENILIKERKNYLKNKKRAKEFILERLEYFNKIYNFSYNKISIRNQRTRWGSCSRKGNLNFNYKIIFLPERLANYIILHELTHLKEMNHSKEFWNLVSLNFPDYKKIKKELRNRGLNNTL